MDDGTAIARAGGRPFDLAYGRWAAGTIEALADEPAAALACYEEGLQVAALHDLQYVGAWICAHLGGVEAQLGRSDDALRTLDRATVPAQLIESPLLAAWADAHRAHAYAVRGDASVAGTHAATALSFARERDHPLLEVISLRRLAAVADPAGSEAHLREALDVATRTQLGALLEPLRCDQAARRHRHVNTAATIPPWRR